MRTIKINFSDWWGGFDKTDNYFYNLLKDNYNIMIGNVPTLKKLDYSHDSYNLFIPLEFWTGKLTSSAFPICALLNNNIFQVRIKFRNSADCINYFGTVAPSNQEIPSIGNSYLLIDYVYLETEERNLFITNELRSTST